MDKIPSRAGEGRGRERVEREDSVENSRESRSSFFPMAIQLHVKWYPFASSLPPGTPGTHHLSHSASRDVLSSHRLATTGSPPLAHAAVAILPPFSPFPIVAGPSLSPVDVTRSTSGTGLCRKRRCCARVCSRPASSEKNTRKIASEVRQNVERVVGAD